MSDLIKQIKGLDKDKIIRPKYGETSLLSWKPKLDEILKKLDFIEKYWKQVDDRTNQRVESYLSGIFQLLNQLVSTNDMQFVSTKNNITTQVVQQYNEIKQYWPQYATAAIEASGLLDNVDVKTEFESLTKKMQNSIKEALLKIEKESQVIIEQAKSKADEIENSVRKTAEKISVKEAQEQFQLASKNNEKNIRIWGIITGGLIVAFISLIICFLSKSLPKEWTWQIVYYSVIRATSIGFIITLIAFSLRILRAHLHMREHNLHRQRIANSMASFAESATNKEQRDIILSRLVDSVATFGNSGMIGNDDDGNSKITIDNIYRTLTAMK